MSTESLDGSDRELWRKNKAAANDNSPSGDGASVTPNENPKSGGGRKQGSGGFCEAADWSESNTRQV